MAENENKEELKEQCPHCQNDDWEEIEVTDSYVESLFGQTFIRECECKKCGKEFTLGYDLTLSSVQ